MDNSHDEDSSTGNPSPKISLPDFNSSSNLQSIRDYAATVQELQRENFDLKLRIFFLEEKNASSSSSPVAGTTQQERQSFQSEHTDREQTSTHEQLTNTTNRIDAHLSTDRHQTSIKTSSDPVSDDNDELRVLRENLNWSRQENVKLRQQLTDCNDKQQKLLAAQKHTQTTATAKLETTRNSDMPVSTYSFQSSDHERRFQERINSLEKQNALLKSALSESQQKYQDEIKINDEQRARTEHLMKQLKDYGAHIAKIEAENRNLSVVHESYRHEQDQTGSNVDVEARHREIHQLERTIQELERKLREMDSNRSSIPIIQHLPALNTYLTEENFQRLKRETESYASLIQSLQADCQRLRQSEHNLEQQVIQLCKAFNISPASSVANPSPQSIGSLVSTVQSVEDPQASITQVTTQIQDTALNVSSVTNHITKLRQDYDEVRNILRDKESLILQYEMRESEFEQRMRQNLDREIRAFEAEKTNLQQQVDEREHRLVEVNNEYNQLKIEYRNDRKELEVKFIEEKRSLQEKNERLIERIQALEQSMIEEQEKYNELQDLYETLRQEFDSKNFPELERTIQQQSQKIERFHTDQQTMENIFQEERLSMQRQQEFQRVEADRVKSELTINIRRVAELQTRYNEAQSIIEAHQDNIDALTLELQTATQYTLENEKLNDQLKLLKIQINVKEDQLQERENEIIKINEAYNNSQAKTAFYENRLQVAEDQIKRCQSELDTFHNQSQYATRQLEECRLETEEWKRKYQIEVNNGLADQNDRHKILSDIQLLREENEMLRNELENLRVRIRIEVSQEYENDYVDRYNKLSERLQKEAEAFSIERSANEHIIQQKNIEIADLENQLNIIGHDLKKAHTVIRNYEQDIELFREDLNKAEEGRRQVEYDLRQQYTNELNIRSDRIKKLESLTQTYETEINQCKHQLKPYQDRIYQIEQLLEGKENKVQKLQQDLYIIDSERKEVKAKLEIDTQRLLEEIAIKQQQVQKYCETLQQKDQHIETLLADIKQFNSPEGDTIAALHEQLLQREREIKEKSSAVNEYQRRINELKSNNQEHERRLNSTHEQLQQAEQKIATQRLETNDLIRKLNSSDIDLKRAIDEKEYYLGQLKISEKELDMEKKKNSGKPFDQRDQYQSIINDLKDRFQEREKTFKKQDQSSNKDENLENSLRTTHQQLDDTREARDKLETNCSQIASRTSRMEQQFKSDAENRDQLIATLRQKINDKDRELNRLHEINITNGKKINELHDKIIKMEPNPDAPYSAQRAPTNVALQLTIKQQDRLIDELKTQLQEAQKKAFGTTDAPSISTVVIQHSKNRGRSNWDQLTREELLYELDDANQCIENLNAQLTNKNPTLSELHAQANELRNQLSRQKYVCQVLWRKLDALIDIHGSNTRAELANELADYKDEVTKLKNLSSRPNEPRPAKINNNSRSSSEQNFCSLNDGNISSMNSEYPTQNIKSTIALLERSNIEWQTKLARLTEQLGRSEHQSRHGLRELNKYQKMLHDAGLIESSVRQRRRSADDSVIIGHIDINKINDDVANMNDINELKDLVRNQRKFIQRLQMRVRTDTSDIVQSPIIEKFNQELMNLNLVINTYKNESNLLKNELKKLYKTIEHNRKMQQNYEKVLQEQQTSIEHSKKQLTRYEKIFEKYDTHLPIFDERKQHAIDAIDEYVIDLDIDVLQANDTLKKTSLAKKDSAFSSATDNNELQQSINQKDIQIQKLNADVNSQRLQIDELVFKLNTAKKTNEDTERHYRMECERIRQDLTGSVHEIENELKQARLQIDSLKSYKTRCDQTENQHEKLQSEIRRLKEENERIESIKNNYKSQLEILERKLHQGNGNDGTLEKSELAQLLNAMRLLRLDLEVSMEKQKELQAKLDESLRHSRTPREFTFSGRGVSYPDLRLLDASGLVGAENISSSTIIEERRTRPIGSSTAEHDHIEFIQSYSGETEQRIIVKRYIIGEIKAHNELRQIIQDIKFDLKAIFPELREKLYSRTSSSSSDGFVRSIEDRFKSIDARLTYVLDLIETYWQDNLPEKNQHNEHIFIDYRLVEENKRLQLLQKKYAQDLQVLKQKYREQSTYLDQLLAQLTKANRRKADTGECLALLLRPTLDVLQKARTNIEHHLKESNTNNNPPGSAQSHRRHRSNRKDKD